MKNKFVSPTRRTSLDRGDASGGLVSGGKHNRCAVFATKSSLVADALEMNDQHWTVHAKVANDLTVQIGDSVFQLHQLPMVSKSGYLNRLAFQRGINEEKSTTPTIELGNFPGGAEMFLLVVKFCYGWKVDLTAANIAPTYCAAHFLEMGDDLQHGNLITKAETFLAYLLFASWKDIFQILRSCKTISSWAQELQIVERCSEAIAWKACLDPRLFTFSDDDEFTENSQQGCVAENWWFGYVIGLRIDHFLEVIELIKQKGIKPELVGSCIAHWTTKWLSQNRFEQHNPSKHLTQRLLGVTADSLIKVLPEEKNSVSCNFLLQLLKLGTAIGISSQLLNHLEERIDMYLKVLC
ncbi:Phototropic-responsive NPH3 family protein [Euphorbia peplus]|nr:Phototropic-responsive NPH3 family protein [Euphorbia peplus]